MRKLLVSFIGMFFILIAGSCFVYADQASDMYFHLSIQKYLEGDLEGAISAAEQAVKMGGAADKKLSAYYVKIMTEKGANLVDNKQYKDALPFFEKAGSFDPQNKEIKDVIDLINQKISPVGGTADREIGGIVSNKGLDKNVTELIKTLQLNQDRLIETLARPGKAMEELIVRSDDERKELIRLLASKDENMVKAVTSQSESLKMLIYLLIAVVFAALVSYFISTRNRAGKEAVILRQQEAILNIMVQQQQALAQGGGLLKLSEAGAISGEFVTPRQMLNDSKPRIRAKGIEIIDARLVRDNSDSEVAARILRPFLADPDNRVRGNAVKILYRYKPEEAVKSAEKMMNGQDKWMRVSGAWLLGDMEGDEKAAEILMGKINDKDYHFKRRVLKSLAKLVDPDNKKHLSPETDAKVSALVHETACKEQWVI